MQTNAGKVHTLVSSRLIYIHVPKCGGSSFGAALRLRYAFSQATIRPQLQPVTGKETPDQRVRRIEAEYAARADCLRRLVAQRTRAIAAHVRYDAHLHRGAARSYGHVAMLRDPVARFVSHYHYLQRRHPDPDRPDTLEAFLETPDAARLGSQYLFYFGGASRDPGAAITALSRFRLVGDLSCPERFAAGLRGLCGGVLPVIHRNRAPQPAQVSRRLRPRLEAVCAPDLEIYHAVLQP